MNMQQVQSLQVHCHTPGAAQLTAHGLHNNRCDESAAGTIITGALSVRTNIDIIKYTRRSVKDCTQPAGLQQSSVQAAK
jgi:hypothetical protein